MNIKYAINKNIINKGNPTAGGWVNHESELATMIELVTKKGYAFSPGILKGKHINKKPAVNDIEGAMLLAVDIDNDIKTYDKQSRKYFPRTKTVAEGYYSFDDAVTDPWLARCAAFIYTTPSYTEQHNRFRIVFILPQVVDDPLQYNNIVAAFIKKFGADESCKNIDRLFYGNNHAKTHVFSKQLDIDSMNDFINSPAIEAKETKLIEKSVNKDNITFEMARKMLAVIPGDALDYTQWFGILSAVGNYFPEDEAVILISEWSPDKQHGTEYKLKNRAAKYSIGTLVFWAKRFGFDTSILNRRNGHVVTKDGKLSQSPDVKNPDEVEKFNEKYSPIEEMKSWIRANYETRLNVVKSKYEIRKLEEVDWRLLEDRDINNIYNYLKGSFYKWASKDNVRSILESDFSPEFNPIISYFNNLPPWDEEDHIRKFCDLVTVEPGQELRWRKYFYKWFVGMVSCALERTQNHECIVLVGPQGIGKTTVINRLVPDELKEYYACTQIDPKDKDTKSMVSEYFLINLDELEGSTREEVSHLKSLMSDPFVTVRKPFARYILNYRRRASFIGSVNRANFLYDISGARRWLVIDCVKIDYQAELNLEQMFTQGLQLLNNGYNHWFAGKDAEDVMDFNRRYEVLSAEEDLLTSKYLPFDDTGLSNEELKTRESAGVILLMTGTEIQHELQKETTVRISHIKLGQFLQRLGYRQRLVRKGNIVKRVYSLTKNDVNLF